MPAAEIIHEDADAEPMELGQRAPRRVDVLDEIILGHLERQSLWIEVECLHHLRDLTHQATVDELANGQIHPHRLWCVSAVLTPPDLTLPARLLQDPATDVRNESRLL